MPSVNVTVTNGGTVVAAPASGRIRLLGYQITSAGNPGRVTLVGGTTTLAGVSSFSANGGGLVAPPVGVGGTPYGDADVGAALTATQVTGAVTVDINVQYCIVGAN